ncbi:MAG: Response regulator consisting of a CheY-like receiver domain and a winged-helix DNA-binding domain [Moraxellaceae bacterium]|jgi:CheY-like chemotaxis protein|nr:Response regulator consisting of a CheY-like receiver domain and a winged-helix DNA-binding domain [Moraxellaceae bacterium]
MQARQIAGAGHQSTKQWCRIHHIGLDERETLVVESLFRSNPELGNRYVFGPAIENDQVDLFFVNADDAAALAAFEVVRQVRPEILAIMASSEEEADFGEYRVIRKPLNFRNFVAILDAITSTNIRDLRSSCDSSIMRVLVVDDSLPARQFMKLMLEKVAMDAGIPLHVDMVDSGEKALEIVRLQAYDLAFLDVEMPGMDGYEVCRQIKLSCAMRIAMLSGRSSPVDFTRGREAGCDNYLPKPANDADLRTILRLTSLKKQVAAPRSPSTVCGSSVLNGGRP